MDISEMDRVDSPIHQNPTNFLIIYISKTS
jgi:hypothetical protein